MSSHNQTLTPALPSWNDGPTRQAIIDFVVRVTTEGSPDFVAPEERIATFDNDGTLWVEKPMPIELGFILGRFAEMAEQDPTLREKQPWQAAYNKDYAWLGNVITKHYQGDDSDVKVLMGGLLKAFENMSVEDYQASAASYLNNSSNPQLGVPNLSTAYAPMIELLRYLEANGFTNYIASGGDRDFMRSITPSLYGIPYERVIGSSSALGFTADESGSTVAYIAEMEVFDDGPKKPVRIWSRIGRRPILAVGNSNGDVPMLQYVSHPARPSLSLLVLHDDAEREFDYVSGAEKSLDVAKASGWTVVSMKNDWNQVFAAQSH